MTKDQKNLAKRYISIIKENDNINNTSVTGNSTQFQVDHTAKFLPIGQDRDEQISKEKGSDKIREKIKAGLTTLKSLIETCSSEKCRLKDISNLIDFFDNPEMKADLNELKLQLQRESQAEGVNARLAY